MKKSCKLGFHFQMKKGLSILEIDYWKKSICIIYSLLNLI